MPCALLGSLDSIFRFFKLITHHQRNWNADCIGKWKG